MRVRVRVLEIIILINYMRLCCLVLENEVAFEPLGKREMCCMVLF